METALHAPILVTGTHRSGTTWIGKILGSDPAVGVIHEPFTRTTRPGVFPYRIPYWYYRVPVPPPADFLTAYEQVLGFHYAYGAELRALRSPYDLGRMIRDAARFALYRSQKRRPLVKDPLALLSADRIASLFGSSVLVTTRHPLAFVGSLTRLGWRFDFADIVGQPDVMDLLGDAAEDAILGRTKGAGDPVVEAAYLWKLLHRVIARYRETHPEWIFVRYEDLARDPIPRFTEIFAKLGLTFGDRARKQLEFLSGETNPPDRENDPRVTRVASSAHATKSLRRLSDEDRDRVRSIVAPVASLYYSDAEW